MRLEVLVPGEALIAGHGDPKGDVSAEEGIRMQVRIPEIRFQLLITDGLLQKRLKFRQVDQFYAMATCRLFKTVQEAATFGKLKRSLEQFLQFSEVLFFSFLCYISIQMSDKGL